MTRLEAIYALASPESRAKIDAMTDEQRALLVNRCAHMFVGRGDRS